MTPTDWKRWRGLKTLVHDAVEHGSRGIERVQKETAATPFGILEQTYETVAFTMGPGEALVLYTDGLTEARRDGELFGEKRLLEVLSDADDRSPRGLIERLRTAVAGFAGELKDDLQILVLRRTG